MGEEGVTELEVERDGGPDKLLKEVERYKAREISVCQKLAVTLPSAPSSFHLLVSVPLVANYC